MFADLCGNPPDDSMLGTGVPMRRRVLYPVKLLAGPAEAKTHANPIFYTINAFRYGLLGSSDVPVWIAYTLMLGLWLPKRGVGLRS